MGGGQGDKPKDNTVRNVGIIFGIIALLLIVILVPLGVMGKLTASSSSSSTGTNVVTGVCTASDSGSCSNYVAAAPTGGGAAGGGSGAATGSGSGTGAPTVSALGLFTVLANTDFNGHDVPGSPVGNGDLNAMANACQANANCVGFNSNGWLKLVAKGAGNWSAGTTFYAKPSAPGSPTAATAPPAGAAPAPGAAAPTPAAPAAPTKIADGQPCTGNWTSGADCASQKCGTLPPYTCLDVNGNAVLNAPCILIGGEKCAPGLQCNGVKCVPSLNTDVARGAQTACFYDSDCNYGTDGAPPACCGAFTIGALKIKQGVCRKSGGNPC
jgi:hypothetical protein